MRELSRQIKPRRISAEDFCLRWLRERREVVAHQRRNLCVFRREEADRPIAAKHQPILAKRLEDHIQIRANIRRLSPSATCITLPDCVRLPAHVWNHGSSVVARQNATNSSSPSERR